MKNNYIRYCEYCGLETNGYELCYDCYLLSKDSSIIQDKNENWIKNPIKGNENKFYDKNKEYYKKNSLMNKYERIFFEKSIKYLKKKNYILCPQVNLQTIIETNTNTRNDELFRNVDFLLIDKTYEPLLIIEINGNTHYYNIYTIERDKSVKAIAYNSNIPILTITNEESNRLTNKNIKSIYKTLITYIEKYKNQKYPQIDIDLNNIDKL